MRSTWKRTLSAILTVCMIASLLVVPASAATAHSHNFTTDGTTSDFFTFSNAESSLKTMETGVTVDGVTYTKGLALTKDSGAAPSSGYIKFTGAGNLKVIIATVSSGDFAVGAKKLHLDGVDSSHRITSAETGIATKEGLSTGEHTLWARDSNLYVLAIEFTPTGTTGGGEGGGDTETPTVETEATKVNTAVEAAIADLKDADNADAITVASASAADATAAKTLVEGWYKDVTVDSGFTATTTISDFRAATDGTEESPNGTDGGFTYTITVAAAAAQASNGDAPAETLAVSDGTVTGNVVIKATPYTAGGGSEEPTNTPGAYTLLSSDQTAVFTAEGITNYGTAGNLTDKNLKMGTDKFFTVHYSAKSKADSSGKTIGGEELSGPRFNLAGKATTTSNSIEFTTKFPAKVKIYWISGGADREMGILDSAGATAAQSHEGSVQNTGYVSTLLLDKAGQYFLGGLTNNNYIYKVVVTEEDVAPRPEFADGGDVYQQTQTDANTVAKFTLKAAPAAETVYKLYSDEALTTPAAADVTVSAGTDVAFTLTTGQTEASATYYMTATVGGKTSWAVPVTVKTFRDVNTVSGVTITEETISLTLGGDTTTATPTTTVTGSKGNDSIEPYTTAWTVDADAAVTVDGTTGVITAAKVGRATVTVTVTDNTDNTVTFSDTVVVNVSGTGTDTTFESKNLGAANKGDFADNDEVKYNDYFTIVCDPNTKFDGSTKEWSENASTDLTEAYESGRRLCLGNGKLNFQTEGPADVTIWFAANNATTVATITDGTTSVSTDTTGQEPNLPYVQTLSLASQGNYSLTSANYIFKVVVTEREPATTYTVTPASGLTGGTVSVDKTSAAENDTITVTVTPSAGYSIGTVSYTPAEGSATTITATEGAYKFAMPAANVTVSATFTKDKTSLAGKDVTIAGMAGTAPVVDETLTASVAEVDAANLDFIWTVDGTEKTDNKGATYTVTADDQTKVITVKAVAKTGNADYEGETNVKTLSAVKGKTLTVTAENVTETYDGRFWSITVTVKDGDTTVKDATITYSTTENGEYTNDKPEMQNAGTYTVYYKVNKAGYEEATGSATVTINKVPKPTITFTDNIAAEKNNTTQAAEANGTSTVVFTVGGALGITVTANPELTGTGESLVKTNDTTWTATFADETKDVVFTASYAGDTNHEKADDVKITIHVVKYGQTKSEATFSAMSQTVYSIGYPSPSPWAGKPDNVSDFYTVAPTFTVDESHPGTIKVAGTLKYVEGFTGFDPGMPSAQEGYYLTWQFPVTGDALTKAVITLVNGNRGEADKSYDMATQSGVLDEDNGVKYFSSIAHVEGKDSKPQVKIDWDGAGEAYTPTTYTLDLSAVEFEGKTVAADTFVVANMTTNNVSTKKEITAEKVGFNTYNVTIDYGELTAHKSSDPAQAAKDGDTFYVGVGVPLFDMDNNSLFVADSADAAPADWTHIGANEEGAHYMTYTNLVPVEGQEGATLTRYYKITADNATTHEADPSGKVSARYTVTYKADKLVYPDYNITKGAETNGTFTVAEKAKAGETVTVTPTAAEGFEVATVTVKGADDSNITATEGTDTNAGKWTFTMPAQNVTVTVTFQEATVTPETRTLTFAVDEGATVAFTAPADAELSAEKTLTVEKTTDVKFTVTVTDDTKELKEVKVGTTVLTAAENVYTVAGAADAADATVTVTLQAKATPVEPMWTLDYDVMDTLGDAGTSIAGGTVVDKSSDLGIKLTYGGGSYAKQTSASTGNEGALVTASGMEAMVKGSDAPTASDFIPNAGTYYKFEATKNGKLLIAYAAFDKKDVVISEQEAGAATATRVAGKGGEMTGNANKGEEINVKAGNTYYLYALTSKVCLYGFSFEAASATAPVVDIAAPANGGEMVEGKTLQLTATVTPEDATLAWTSDNTEVATVDAATGLVTAVKAGTATITVTATKGEETGTDAVTIKVNEAGVYILNPSTDLPGDTGIAETRKAGTGDYFTIIPKVDSKGNMKTKTKGSSKEFEGGFTGTQRLEIGGAFDAGDKLPAVGFTTGGPATVKIWWIPNGAGREIGIYKAADGASVTATAVAATETTKSNPVVSELTLTEAGEYLLGGTGSVYIFQIQVTDKASASKFTVTVADAVKDNVTVDPSLAAEGATVTVTVTPPTGKVLDTLTYTAEGSSTPVDIDKTTKTFTMPAANVTVSATFKEATAADTGLVLDPAEYPACMDQAVVTDATVKEVSGTNFGVTNVKMRSPAKASEGATEPATPTSFELAKAGGSTLTFTTPAVTEGQTIKVVANLNSNNSTEKGEYTLKAGDAVVKTEAVGTTNEKADYTWELQPETTYTLTSSSTTRALRVNKLEIKVVDGSTTEKVTVTYEWAFDVAPATTPTAPAAVEIDKGGKVTSLPTAETVEGYTFAGWFVGETAFTTDTVVNENTTVTGKYTKDAAPEVNKDALNDAIAAAELTLSKATVAENGDEVLTTDNWITAADKEAVETAIATAKEVAGKTDATQEEVDGAKTALDTALAGKFQKGTKVVTKADLEAAIDAAEKASAAITVAEDAADVTKGTKFVKQADKDAYDAKIAEAQAVIDTLADKTDEDLTAEDKTNIENALHALNEATHAFELAQDEGTKSSGGYRPSGSSSTAGTGNTKTETKPDGTKVVTETKRDGTVTVTQTKPDGTKVVTTTKPDGESTTTVTVPGSVDKTVVSVPVTDANTGMVPVIVKADGTEEIIRDSSVEDGEVVFPLEESATIKIVNNAKHFVDIDGHWAEDEANYVSARELFNGVDATHFAPDATMTRGMMATVLFRLDGESKSDKAVDFSDVKVGDWFADAVEWASEIGVINGYTDGTFAPNKSITRQELVVMVYRYAGNPEADASAMNSFKDVDDVADWAADAMNWAVKNGIINGKGNGVLDPKGNATRAEVSAVLARFVKLANQ